MLAKKAISSYVNAPPSNNGAPARYVVEVVIDQLRDGFLDRRRLEIAAWVIEELAGIPHPDWLLKDHQKRVANFLASRMPKPPINEVR